MNETAQLAAEHAFKAFSNPCQIHSRMTTSMHPISVFYPGIPQPRIQGKGQGDSTSAMEQVLPILASAETAADDEVPAKNTTVLNVPGTKTMELIKIPLTLDKLASTSDDQLPPLLSMIIDGLPPCHQSKYVHEAEKRLLKYVERYQNVSSLSSYYRVGLCSTSYIHPGVISVDRLVTISLHYAYLFVVDDLFFDTQDESLFNQYGISHSICESPDKIQGYLDHLNAVFGQQVPPSNPTPLIETMLQEVGRDMLEMSNPEWFDNFLACVVEHLRTSTASHRDIVQGHNLCFQDLESYTIMRAGNVGGGFIQSMAQFAKDTYISGSLRVTPYMENITMATAIHIGFVNDVFSYYRESMLEQNPRNLISVLMKCEGKPFIETVHMAIGLVNSYARAIMDLEVEAWNSTLQNHLQEIKAVMAGNVYFCIMDKRYRHPDSFFPELRDMTSSWKILPDVEGPEL